MDEQSEMATEATEQAAGRQRAPRAAGAASVQAEAPATDRCYGCGGRENLNGWPFCWPCVERRHWREDAAAAAIREVRQVYRAWKLAGGEPLV